MRTRMAGAVLIAASLVAILALHLLVIRAPDAPASPLQLVLAGFAVLAGLPGLAMLIDGRAIFGTTDRPWRR